MNRKFKRIISTITLSACIFLNIPTIIKAEDTISINSNRINFALQGSATSSNTESGQEAVWGPDKTIDGIVNRDEEKTKQSRWATDKGTEERVLTIDLKSEKSFNEFNIEWERTNIKNFNIKVSDNNVDFTEVFNKNDNLNIIDLKTNIKLAQPVTGRYVKLSIHGYDGGTVNWPSVSLYEFEIIGDSVVEEDPTTNIALNKPATSSSDEAPSLNAVKAVDGVKGKSNRWASAVRSNEEWLTVDLGTISKIKTVIIDWERRNATNYEIQVSNDNNNWTPVKSINSHPKYINDKIVLDNTVQGRYIKLLIKSHALTDQVSGGVSWNNVSVEEFSVYSGDIPETVEEVAKKIQVPIIGENDNKLTMPTVQEGFNIKFVGADYEQVIGKDLTIYKPIVDTNVKLSFEVSKGSEKAYTEEFTVNVPGKYSIEEGTNSKPVVIPEIREWVGHNDNFEINDLSRIIIDPAYKDKLTTMANTFAEDYKSITGKEITVLESNDPKAGDFYFTFDTEDKGLGKEGHLITIDDSIKIEAQDSVGAYWATISILQILKQNGTTIPKGIIRDYPKYEVRGFMLDVGRMPFSFEYLQDTAKIMSWYKLNDFQIHLNDNYIFLEDYSNNGEDPMNAYSGFRLESDIKEGGNNGLNKADLTNKDTFYTKAEFRNFIKESREIGINIVPEFDTPAHALPFTKVRPDLKMGDVGRQADHLDVTNPGSLEFVKELWDEYLDGEDPVFDSQTTVNIGTDEYDARYTEQFRKFTDDLLGYVQDEKERTVRLWGSLTARPGKTPVRSENVQMNIWNSGWANPNEMFNLGYDLINMLDGTLYIVPGADYYYDYLNKNYLYTSWQPNVMASTSIPAGHDQMLGSAYAVWNDMIDKRNNGITEYDVYHRFIDALPAFSSKLWGDAKDLSFNELEAKVDEIGDAPNTNLSNNIESKTDDVLNLGLDDDKDISGNGYDIKNKINSDIVNIDGRNSLKLNGNNSYAETILTDIGMGSTLQFKVKKNSNDSSEQILFESEKGSLKAVQVGTGNLGFSRAGRDYSFNYKLPDNEWVELAFTNIKDKTSLYVNGELVQTIGDSGRGVGKIHATFNIPLTRIGSKTKAFNGYIDDIKVIKGNVQVSTLDLVNSIAETTALVKEDYTTESWNVLENSISEGKVILERINVTKEEVDNIKNKIDLAVSSLVLKVDAPIENVNKEELQKLYEDNKDKMAENYTLASWEKFNKALEEVKNVLANEEATQESVNLALNNLNDAIQSLEQKEPEDEDVNKEELQKLYEDNKDKKEEDYTVASWEKFNKALEEVKNVLANEEATQESVNLALNNLKEAIQSLEDIEPEEEKINKDKLVELYEKNKNKKEAKYSKETWNAFNKALNEAKLVLDNKQATQEEVNIVFSNLENAIKNLNEKINDKETITEKPKDKPIDKKDKLLGSNPNNLNTLPQTGGNTPITGIVIAIVFVIAGVIFIIYDKKANKKISS